MPSPRPSFGPLLDALRGTSWPARRSVRGTSAGTHRSGLRGISPEFTEYRPYRQGDDPHRLDWKLLARTDRAYLRITNDRATLATMVVVDGSASMDFPADTAAKWVQACQLAVGLAAVAHAAGDPVGVVVASARGVQSLAPRTRRGVVGEVARLLEEVVPAGEPPLAPALALVRPTHRVAIISDFLGDDGDTLLRAVRERLRAGAEVYAVHVIAREELDPRGGAILATDPERPELRRPLVDATRAEYARAFAAWRTGLAHAWRAAGAGYAEVVTDERAAHAVRRIVEPAAGAAARESRW